MYEFMDPNTAREYVKSLNVLEEIFVRRIVLDTMVIRDSIECADLLEELDKKITNYNISSAWGLTTSQIKDFFFNLPIDEMKWFYLYIKDLKDSDNYYALLNELSANVYSQKLDMLFQKRVESMNYKELGIYLEELLKPNSLRGCSSQIEYLVGNFVYDNLYDLTNYVYEKFKNEDVNILMKKYGVNH